MTKCNYAFESVAILLHFKKEMNQLNRIWFDIPKKIKIKERDLLRNMSKGNTFRQVNSQILTFIALLKRLMFTNTCPHFK